MNVAFTNQFVDLSLRQLVLSRSSWPAFNRLPKAAYYERRLSSKRDTDYIILLRSWRDQCHEAILCDAKHSAIDRWYHCKHERFSIRNILRKIGHSHS